MVAAEKPLEHIRADWMIADFQIERFHRIFMHVQ